MASGLAFLRWPVKLKHLTDFDYVLYVGDLLDGLSLGERLRPLGVEYDVYPLEPLASPTLFSLLGLLGLLRSRLREGQRVAVVDAGTGALVEAAWLLLQEGRLPPRAMVDRLTSPLHYRLLYALQVLAEAGVELASEADRFTPHAFTGGDAVRSDRVLVAADLEKQLGLRGAAAAVYRGSPPRELAGVLDALDPRMEGAVEVVALRGGPRGVEAVLGCRLLLHPLGCGPEEAAVAEPLAGLLAVHGRRLAAVYSAAPEEAACLAYPEYGCSEAEDGEEPGAA
jgi:hypothetical protein